jgi:predicted transcriptional regulator YdeE
VKLIVKVVRLEAVRGAGLRESAEVSTEVSTEAAGRIWGRLIASHGNWPAAGAPFGLRQEDGGYAAGRPIHPGASIPEGLGEIEMPGGWYAGAVHEGAYDRFGGTLRRIEEEWLPHSGFRRVAGPAVERYLNDPREVPEAGLRTEVCLPVAPDPIE